MTQAPFTGSPFRTAENPTQPPPKRRGRPPGSTNRKTRKSLKTEIGGTLALLNMGIAMTPVRDDALDAVEIEALANGLNEEAQRSPQFRKYLEYVIGVTGAGGSLLPVIGMIAGRRAARHGYLPREFDTLLGSVLAMSTTEKIPDVPAAAPDMPVSPFMEMPLEYPSDQAPEPIADTEPIATPIVNDSDSSNGVTDFGISDVKVDSGTDEE